MPWINQELCTGCKTCMEECCVGAILMQAELAFIQEQKCIRCGVCHSVCPEHAVRHDGERIPAEVQANLDWARQLLEHEFYAHDRDKQQQLLERLLRFFAKDIKVAEQTIEQLSILKNTQYTNN